MVFYLVNHHKYGIHYKKKRGEHSLLLLHFSKAGFLHFISVLSVFNKQTPVVIFFHWQYKLLLMHLLLKQLLSSTQKRVKHFFNLTYFFWT
jgi:hypothetical protein